MFYFQHEILNFAVSAQLALHHLSDASILLVQCVEDMPNEVTSFGDLMCHDNAALNYSSL